MSEVKQEVKVPEDDVDGGMDMGTVMIENERFLASELEEGALDRINKQDRDYTQYRHLFKNEQQYDLFQRLPGGTQVKNTILQTLLEQNADSD